MMSFFSQQLDSIDQLMEAGGGVLWLIALATLLMWSLLIERAIYFRKVFPGLAKRVGDEWQARAERSSWGAQKIRDFRLSQLSQKLFQNISLIKVLVALCPLFGLLGTVTGMIRVFDVMALTGSSNARSMASGISMATLPTMAGMVAALSGLYLSSLIEAWAQKEKRQMSFNLALDSKGQKL